MNTSFLRGIVSILVATLILFVISGDSAVYAAASTPDWFEEVSREYDVIRTGIENGSQLSVWSREARQKNLIVKIDTLKKTSPVNLPENIPYRQLLDTYLSVLQIKYADVSQINPDVPSNPLPTYSELIREIKAVDAKKDSDGRKMDEEEYELRRAKVMTNLQAFIEQEKKNDQLPIDKKIKYVDQLLTMYDRLFQRKPVFDESSGEVVFSGFAGSSSSDDVSSTSPAQSIVITIPSSGNSTLQENKDNVIVITGVTGSSTALKTENATSTSTNTSSDNKDNKEKKQESLAVAQEEKKEEPIGVGTPLIIVSPSQGSTPPTSPAQSAPSNSGQNSAGKEKEAADITPTINIRARAPEGSENQTSFIRVGQAVQNAAPSQVEHTQNTSAGLLVGLFKKLGRSVQAKKLSKIPVGGELLEGTDSDQDGLSDELENALGTNPLLADTDNDGYSDGVEMKNGYSPTSTIKRKKLFLKKHALGVLGMFLFDAQKPEYLWYIDPRNAKRYLVGSSKEKILSERQSSS